MSSSFAQKFLENARISPEIFQLRSDYRALLLVIENIPPGPSDSTSIALLQEAEKSAQEALAKSNINDIPHVAAWRDTYKAFGAKPKKERNSLESLMRRANDGLPRVNRLTDIYNAISIKHQIPVGGEDLDKYVGSAILRRAIGNETFQTTAGGEATTEHPMAGEAVWCDEVGVTCRRWNWRQCSNTALSESTTRVLFILDALEPCSDAILQSAADELVQTLSSLSTEVTCSQRLLGKP
jgi:DNA/RNA-binding domain of Phe-tRNA-synthetase-like protein